MTWTPERPIAPHALPERLRPDQVLYAYNGPVLFTLKMGLFEALAYKVDETDDIDLFLIKLLLGDELNLLVRGELSLRGALSADTYWLVETQGQLEPRRTWRIQADELPETYLPMAGFGIIPGQRALADSVVQSGAFFAAKFRGSALHKHSMPFRIFKDLTDRVYEASNRLFRPDAISGLRSREVFDLPIRQPQFASLLVAIESPKIDVALVNLRNVARGIPARGNYVEDSYRRREAFFNTAQEVADEANRGGVSDSYAADHYFLLETIEALLPTDDGAVSSTEFSADGQIARKHVEFGHASGAAIRRAFSSARTRPVRVSGRIELINGPSSTFVMRDVVSGRAITCYLSPEWFQRFHRSGELKYGGTAVVFGELQRRKQRDWLVVRSEPHFAAPEQSSLGSLF
jgi:hypothetical protein